jgi:hypothetical protein
MRRLNTPFSALTALAGFTELLKSDRDGSREVLGSDAFLAVVQFSPAHQHNRMIADPKCVRNQVTKLCYARQLEISGKELTSNAILCKSVHLCCADLDLQREELLSSEREHCGVKRLHAQLTSQLSCCWGHTYWEHESQPHSSISWGEGRQQMYKPYM